MKITRIETLQWKAYPRLLVVRAHTDSGIIGLGETVDKIPGAKAALHGTIAPLVLGKTADIRDCALRHGQHMYHGYAARDARLSAFGSHFGHMGSVRRAALSPARRQTRDEIPTYNPVRFGAIRDYKPAQRRRRLARSLFREEIYALKSALDQFSERSFASDITLRVEKSLIPIKQIRTRRRSNGDRHRMPFAGIAPRWSASPAPSSP